MADALSSARNYIAQGWSPVPVPYKEKGPVLDDWHTLRITAGNVERYFNGGLQNVGVILGPPSGHLTDIDLDCAEALELAATFLPPTVRFGRTSTRAAHWLYRAEFPAGLKSVLAFDDPIKLRTNAKAARLVEIRSGAGGKGAQTVFPGSVHESNEPITWEDDNATQTPTNIEAGALRLAVAKLAAAALLVRYWPPRGNRHDLSLAVGGVLARANWTVPAIETFVDAIVKAAQDPRPVDRVRCARDAAENVAAGEPAYGFPRLQDILGAGVAGKLADWLGLGIVGTVRGGVVIKCGVDLTAAATAAERAIAAAGPPLFRRGAALVRPLVLEARGADDRPIKTVGLEGISVIMARSFMEQAASFEKFDARQKTWIPCKPPSDVAELIVARAGYWPFPPVRGVLAAPSLRPDGSIVARPGYDVATEMFLIDPPAMPDIPERPTRAQGNQALDRLDALLEGFPWQGDDDARAVGLSALMSPVLRAALPTIPLHAISAPEAGTGKGYLTQVAAAIATGFPCPVISTGKDDEELEKRLSAAALAGHAILSIDNVSRPLGGDFLCQLLDQPMLKVRILGQSAGPLIEPRMALFATGNNLTLLGDVVRRAVVAHMDAGQEDPWRRQFTTDPVARVLADRGAYVAAALTAVRAFLVSGDEPLPSVASFAAWSKFVRSTLVWLGYGDPVKTIATAAVDDPDRQTLAAVLTTWSGTVGSTEITVAELVSRANERDQFGGWANRDLRGALMMAATNKSGGDINPLRLGNWLRSHRDRRNGQLVLRRRGQDPHTKTIQWAVLQV